MELLVLQTLLLWRPLPMLQLVPQPQWTSSRRSCGKKRQWGLQGKEPRGVLGQASTVAPGTTTPAAPSRAHSPAVDPTETSPGIPQREPNALHLGLEAHQVS
jgi:hypothetical protein